MKQITEDYVSFETAKLLKEKGFDDEYTNAFYDKTENLYFIDLLSDLSEHTDNDTDIAASTLHVVMKWLREVHNLHITIKPYITEDGIMYLFEIYKLEAEKFTLIRSKTGFEKCEEAEESAIRYVLENLI